jgi:hypothetical protein
MRGHRLQGRFDIDYESLSIYEGITEDLGYIVGIEIDWFEWDQIYMDNNYSSVVDPIYDVSSTVVGGGRRWKNSIKVPVVMAQFVTGRNVMNTRGFYTTDTLRLVINMDEMQERFPGFMTTKDASDHIRDRIVFQNQVFHPTIVMPRGHFGKRWAVLSVDCNQVNPEELVNDVQFQQYALPSTTDPRLSVYGAGPYSSGQYGD